MSAFAFLFDVKNYYLFFKTAYANSISALKFTNKTLGFSFVFFFFLFCL